MVKSILRALSCTFSILAKVVSVLQIDYAFYAKVLKLHFLESKIEIEDELKSLLMKVKEEWKSWLKA